MATIEKRTSKTKTTYRVKVKLKGFPEASATFERLTDAKKWAQETETKMREGRHFKSTASRNHTLKDAIERYLKNVLPARPRSLCTRTTQLNHWKTLLGNYALANITAALIVEERDKLTSILDKDFILRG